MLLATMATGMMVIGLTWRPPETPCRMVSHWYMDRPRSLGVPSDFFPRGDDPAGSGPPLCTKPSKIAKKTVKWELPDQVGTFRRGWREFVDMLGEHSSTGSALTLRGVQKERPSPWDLEDDMEIVTVPTLLVTGDEDEPCLPPAIFMKRAIRSSGLAVIPKAGRAVNLEEPDAFNRTIANFLDLVEAGRWDLRDPRSVTASILGSR